MLLPKHQGSCLVAIIGRIVSSQRGRSVVGMGSSVRNFLAAPETKLCTSRSVNGLNLVNSSGVVDVAPQQAVSLSRVLPGALQ